MRAGQKEGAKRSRAHLPPEHGSPSSCVRQKICFERVTAFSLPLLLKKEERAGERRCFLSISPLSDSLPARSSRGERGKTPQAFCVPNTTGLRAAAPSHHPQRCGSQTSQTRAPINPKGIGASSPRLACNAYLGCALGNRINANGVVAEVRRAGGNGWASTALRLGMFVGR